MIEITIKHHPVRTMTVALMAFVCLLSVVVISTRIANAGDATVHDGEHILKVHDGDSEQGFITKATTLRAALSDAHIRIDPNDITEPALDESLVASTYDVNIYRARPVVVRDGSSNTKIITAYRTGKQIASQAGITLNDADITKLAPSSDPITDGAAEIMTIDRATPVTFVFYGKRTETSTRATTVAEFLTEKGVKAAADDTLSPSGATTVTRGMVIQLWKNGKQTVTVDEDIAFTARQVNDTNHTVGYKEVQTQGVNGKRTVTYELVMRDGKESSRAVANSVTTLQPVEQVEVIGTKVNLATGSHEDWMAAAGIAQSDYGYVNYIVGSESGWSYAKYNYAGSGAYGLCQALPASKMSTMGSDYMTNPVTQLKWCNGYANSRYGGWEGAYNAWMSKHWW